MGKHRKPKIKEIKEFAKKKNGVCLSNNYVNSKTLMDWECEKKHIFKSNWNNVQQGKWCPDCAGNKNKNIDDMKFLATKNNGDCLSTEYINSHTLLLWKCEKGHEWEASPTNIHQGQWCPKCGRKSAADKLRGDIETIKKIALERGGECLSASYVNSQTNLLFRCINNHEWEAPPNRIRQGGWCSKCSDSLGERICREFLEQVFQRKFPKSYPEWLRTKDGNQLELDGYCIELGIAFEHHGQHHYQYHPYRHKNKKEFSAQVNRDKLKKDLCKTNSIKLIVIPEIFTITKLNTLSNYFKNQLKINNIKIDDHSVFSCININKAYHCEYATTQLDAMRAIALSKGGKCLSQNYIASDQIMEFECHKGHTFPSIPDNIKAGHWCKKCSGNEKLTITKMQEIAAERGGKCLSTTYTNSRTHLIWMCEKGHSFPASPNNVMHNKTWCPECYEEKRNKNKQGKK